MKYSFDVQAVRQAIKGDRFLRIEMETDTEFENELLFSSFDEYEFFENSLAWNEAERFCVSKTGHLATENLKSSQGV